MKQQQTNLERRNLLKTLAAAPAVAGVAAVATPAVASEKAEAQQSGYKETDHVRSYYASLRGL